MRICTKISDIHSIRRFMMREVTGDECLAEKFAHICSFQLPLRQTSKVFLRILHPSKDTEINSHLRALNSTHRTLLSNAKNSALESINTFTSPKNVTVSDASINIDIFKSCVINTVVSKGGGHGVSSPIHTWSIDSRGQPRQSQQRKIVIDFSSPNIAKPFHAGHLRSTMIGNYIANIRSALGDQVTRINYFGDWGTQFGLVTAGYRLYGDETQLKANAIQHLHELYVKMNQLLPTDTRLAEEAERACTDLERGDVDITELWRRFREASVDNYNQLYKRLGVKFDSHEWESSNHITAKSLCRDLLEQGRLQQEDGAYFVQFKPNKGQEERRVILLKANGSTLYSSRDVTGFLSRYQKYEFDKVLYVVERGQENHFSNVTDIIDHLQLMPVNNPQLTANSLLEHVKFGRVAGMSTRKGTAVLLSDILEEAKQRMMGKMEQAHTTQTTGDELAHIAECLSSSAVIIYDLKLSRAKGYTFSWEDVVSFSPDTGPFLQITHARLCSLQRNCGVELNLSANLESLVESEAIRVVAHLARYDEAVKKSAATLEAHVLVRYLFDLCHLSNAAFKTLSVKGKEQHIAESRLLMFHCVQLTLHNGIKLLGIEPLRSI